MSDQATEIKERGILFSAEMVRALLDRRKTQTRRVMNPQPPDDANYVPEDDVFTVGTACAFDGWKAPDCPYGVPGDRLWVRETFAKVGDNEDDIHGAYHYLPHGSVYYRADNPLPGDLKWRPSIFMPRWASRITLEITEVRVQRVQEITERDAISEGVLYAAGGTPDEFQIRNSPLRCFGRLWDSINAKRGYSLESNPWVRAITFRRLQLCTS
ncbi:MAG: hypothetical protein ACE1Y4_03355 [Lysobacterales bacterium]